MAIETLYADAHLAGTFSNPNNAIGNTPDTWAGDLNANSSYTSRWSMANPVDPLTSGVTHTVGVLARKGSNSGIPTIAINLYQAGTLVASTGAQDVSNNVGLVISVTFTTAEMTPSAGVEIEVVQTSAGGSPSVRNCAQIAYIEWQADTTAEVAGTYTGDIASTLPALTQSASGSFSIPVGDSQFVNSFEGGTDGADITPANSGGASGDAFDTVFANGEGVVAQYDTAQAAVGTLSGLFTHTGTTGATLIEWTTIGPYTPDSYYRVYMFLEAIPTDHFYFLNIRNSSGTIVARIRLSSGGTLRLRDTNAFQFTSSVTVMPTNQWVRLELKIIHSDTEGHMVLRIFTDANSTTPDETLGDEVTNLVTGVDADEVEFGILDQPLLDVGSFNMWLDDIGINNVDWFGPSGIAGSHTGDIASTLPALSQSASGSFTTPVGTGDIASVLSSLIQSASGSFTPAGGGGGGVVTIESVTHTALDGNPEVNPVFNMPATRPDGDLYILHFTSDDEAALTVPAGWTEVVAQTDDQLNTAYQIIAWKIGSSEPATYQLDGPAATPLITVVRLSGIDDTTPINQFASNRGTSALAISPAVTPSVANTLVFRFFSSDGAQFTSGPPTAEYNLQHTGAGDVVNAGSFEDGINGTSSGTADADLEASDQWMTATLAIASSDASVIYTGDIASVLSALMQSASGSFVQPVDVGDITSSLPTFQQSASGVFAQPVDVGDITSTLPAFEQSAAGTFSAPVGVGAIASVLPTFEQSTTGSFTQPVDVGDITSSLPSLTQSASGSFTESVGSGDYTDIYSDIYGSDNSISSVLPSFIQSASGSVSVPPSGIYTDIYSDIYGSDNNIDSVLPVFQQSASGSTTAPMDTGDITSGLPSLQQSATGSFSQPVDIGIITSTLPSLVQSAGGTTSTPVGTGDIASNLPSFTQFAEGSYTQPVDVGTITTTLPAFEQSAIGSVTAPIGAGDIASVLPTFEQSATGTFEPPGAIEVSDPGYLFIHDSTDKQNVDISTANDKQLYVIDVPTDDAYLNIPVVTDKQLVTVTETPSRTLEVEEADANMLAT